MEKTIKLSISLGLGLFVMCSASLLVFCDFTLQQYAMIFGCMAIASVLFLVINRRH